MTAKNEISSSGVYSNCGEINYFLTVIMFGITNHEGYDGIPILDYHLFASYLSEFLTNQSFAWCTWGIWSFDELNVEKSRQNPRYQINDIHNQNRWGWSAMQMHRSCFNHKKHSRLCLDGVSQIAPTIPGSFVYIGVSLHVQYCYFMQKTNCHFADYCKTCKKQIGEKDHKASMMQSNVYQLLQHHIAFWEMMQLLKEVSFVGINFANLKTCMLFPSITLQCLLNAILM